MTEEKPEKGPEPAEQTPEPAAAEEEEDAGIDARVLLVIGVIVLIIIVIYWRQTSTTESDSGERGRVERAQQDQPQPGQQAPSRPPTYAEFKTIRRQQSVGFLYHFGDKRLVVSRPPINARQTEKGVIPAQAGEFYDVTVLREGVKPFELYRRFVGEQVAFRDSFVPVGLPMGDPPKPVAPVFRKAAEVASAPGAESLQVSEGETVIGLAVGDAARAYPKKFAMFHDVINDTVGDKPVVIAYNGVAGATCVFERVLNGQEIVFGCSGLIYQAANVLYDRGSMGLWSGITGEGLSGAMADKKLAPLAVVEAPWSYWKAKHPDTLVMVGTDPKIPVPYGQDLTVGGDEYHQNAGILYPVEGFEPGVTSPAKTRVLGIAVPDGAKAYEVSYLEKASKLEDAVGNTRVVIAYDPASGVADVRTADGRQLVGQKMYWFAWLGNHPKSEIQVLQSLPSVMGVGGDTSGLGAAQMGTPNVEPAPAPAAPKPPEKRPAAAEPGGAM